MNQEQILGIVRMFLTMLGSILATKGVIDNAAVTSDVDIVMTAIGAMIAAISLLWNLWSKTHKRTIAAAAALPKVQAIVMTDQTAADKVLSTKVVGPDQVSGAAP